MMKLFFFLPLTRTPPLYPLTTQVAAARLDALENDNADAEGGDGDDSEYEIEDAEGELTRIPHPSD